MLYYCVEKLQDGGIGYVTRHTSANGANAECRRREFADWAHANGQTSSYTVVTYGNKGL